MDKASGDAIEAWVSAGGVLLLFSNDRDNTEFTHFDTLSDRFGIHFNPVLSHHVVDPDHSTGEVVIPPGTGIFGAGFTAYMKDTSTITVSGPAKALVTDHGDVMIAVSHVGKGVVLGVVDPWFYNEYADGRKMGQYHGFEAAKDVADWARPAIKIGRVEESTQPETPPPAAPQSARSALPAPASPSPSSTSSSRATRVPSSYPYMPSEPASLCALALASLRKSSASVARASGRRSLIQRRQPLFHQRPDLHPELCQQCCGLFFGVGHIRRETCLG